MTDSVTVFLLTVILLFWLRRRLKRTLSEIKITPELTEVVFPVKEPSPNDDVPPWEAPGVDYRARAFINPFEAMVYWQMIDYLQVGCGVAFLWLGLKLQIWWVVLVVALIVYAALAYFLHQVLYVQIRDFGFFSFVLRREEKEGVRLRAFRTIAIAAAWGDVILGVVIYLPAWTFFYRLEPGLILEFAVMALPFYTVKVLRQASTIALKTPRPPWVSIGAALVFTPVLLAWLTGSATWWLKSRGKPLVESAVTATLPPESYSRSSTATGWEGKNRTFHVAVALSGGGYRAAVAHAGLLEALADQKVPIDYLTTVSGGSIIGAAYALGIPPSSFAGRLREGRPGLATDLLCFTGAIREWVLPWSSNTKVYSDHLRRAFFGDRTLADLPDRPRLLVNATDLESDRREPREVFFKGRAPTLNAGEGRSLDQTTHIADVVAASGAFPGAFQPMRLRWVADDTATSLKERQFIDGGVVENLGIEGLRRFLRLSSAALPDVLIVSDASLYSTGAEFKRKVELLALLARSQSLSYEALHRQLYARYTGQTDFWNWSAKEPLYSQVSSMPYKEIDSSLGGRAPENLATVVIPITAPEPPPALRALSGCELIPGEPIAAVQKRVSAFDTLRELDTDEAEAAFWLGYTMGWLYSGAIECARQRTIDASHVCAPLPAAAGTTCRSLEAVISTK